MVCYFYTEAAQPVNHFAQTSSKAEAMNVFLVDDSVIIRERLKRMLAVMEEVKVIGESGDVQETMDAILKQKSDVVLLDIPFPNGSGLDMLQCLKKATPAPVVIILTNDTYPQYRRKCLEVGADFVIDKATEFDQVVPVLKQLIQQTNDDDGSSAQVTQ